MNSIHLFIIGFAIGNFHRLLTSQFLIDSNETHTQQNVRPIVTYLPAKYRDNRVKGCGIGGNDRLGLEGVEEREGEEESSSLSPASSNGVQGVVSSAVSFCGEPS